jgi:protein-S-isoprenylcysteine O-methyltransferase Ste14
MDTDTTASNSSPPWLVSVAAVLAGVLIGFLIVPVPFIGMLKGNPFTHWQEWSAWAAIIAGNGICHTGLRRFYGQSQYRVPILIGYVFVFLFCASIALCLRLHSCLFPADNLPLDALIRTIGLGIILLGTIIQIKSIGKSRKERSNDLDWTAATPILNVRHPILLSWLLILTGLPAAFGVWMPLCAIPGFFVGITWWLRHEETRLKSNLGPKYEEFLARTQRLIPSRLPRTHAD